MYDWIFICGLFAAFFTAWGIGANDCANSFATSVGAKVLTLRNAVIIAGIFEFGGAVLMGSHVTDFIRKKIVSIDIFEDDPYALSLGMLCADAASGIVLAVYTYLKLPTSTTHSIIAAIVGVSLAFGGSEAVKWDKVGLIVVSWVASPSIAALFSSTFFATLNNFVFQSKNPMNRILMLFPILTFITFFINSLFIIYKGSPQLDLDELPFWKSFLISFGISVATALVTQFGYVPYVKKRVDKEAEEIELEGGDGNGEITNSNNELTRTKSYNQATGLNVNTMNIDLSEESTTDNVEGDIDDFKFDNTKNLEHNITESRKYVKMLETKQINDKIEKLHDNAHKLDYKSDRLCSWIQIITACFSAFAHGSNDVANAVAPLATIYHIYKHGSITKKADVPVWILLIGGFGIVVGLASWGYKIINRMGKELTKISPSRGFIIELSAALTVIIASRASIPVSTTHCQVGSIIGCGLVGGFKNVEWKLLGKIVLSWMITLPAAGLLSAAFFSFAYYSPSEREEMLYNLTSV